MLCKIKHQKGAAEKNEGTGEIFVTPEPLQILLIHILWKLHFSISPSSVPSVYILYVTVLSMVLEFETRSTRPHSALEGTMDLSREAM
jgi:hypothetical protein